jgi:hypothetical protein
MLNLFFVFAGPTMTEEKRALVLDLVEWVAIQPRTYSEVMEAWRTSCPRLTIWEDAVDRGLVSCRREKGIRTIVRATPLGLAVLKDAGRLPGTIASAAVD